jgi:hypothetical protein
MEVFVSDSKFHLHSMRYVLYWTLLTVFHEFDCLGLERHIWKGSMDIFYRMTVYTALELHGFGFFFMTPTESEVFFSCKIRSVQESLIEELIEYTIECCLVHLTRLNKSSLECTKGNGLLMFEI